MQKLCVLFFFVFNAYTMDFKIFELHDAYKKHIHRYIENTADNKKVLDAYESFFGLLTNAFLLEHKLSQDDIKTIYEVLTKITHNFANVNKPLSPEMKPLKKTPAPVVRIYYPLTIASSIMEGTEDYDADIIIAALSVPPGEKNDLGNIINSYTHALNKEVFEITDPSLSIVERMARMNAKLKRTSLLLLAETIQLCKEMSDCPNSTWTVEQNSAYYKQARDLVELLPYGCDLKLKLNKDVTRYLENQQRLIKLKKNNKK